MARDFFDGLGETLTRTAREWSGKAESLYETQKLRGRISGEERTIEKMMADIGTIVYKKYMAGEQAEGEIGVLCEEISQHMRLIEDLKEKMAALRGQKLCPSCQKQVEREAAFCPYCGAVCPTPEPESQSGDVLDMEEWNAGKDEEIFEPEEPPKEEKPSSEGEAVSSDEKN